MMLALAIGGLAMLAVFGWLAFVAALAFVRHERARHERELARVKQDSDRASAHFGCEMERHTEQMRDVSEAWRQAMERAFNMQQYGTVRPQEAVVTAPEPDAEARVLRRISEDSIDAGASALKKMYDEAGIPVSVEEVREEAHSMLLGLSPKINPERALIPRED